MKSVFSLLTVAAIALGLSGCHSVAGFLSPHGRNLIDGSCGHCADCPETCQSCDDPEGRGNGVACTGCCGQVPGGCCGACCGDGCAAGRCGLVDRLRARNAFNPGPPTGAVAYPYYTTRGPRDFLAKNPTSIGP
ncbi:MAG: hypothetical protein GX621_17735 [Pirellulaceae bacterium]|nr:hypothetical protein [Pirellulaceae bacterium]